MLPTLRGELMPSLHEVVQQEKISQEERRKRFGQALSEALAGRSLRQSHLAELLVTTQSTVSAWINGRSEPSASTVFTVERALDLAPGMLSKLLGYLPVEAAGRIPNVEEAVQASDLVDTDAKRMILNVWFTLVNKEQTYRTATAAASAAAQAREVPEPAKAPAKRSTKATKAASATNGTNGHLTKAATPKKSAAPRSRRRPQTA